MAKKKREERQAARKERKAEVEQVKTEKKADKAEFRAKKRAKKKAPAESPVVEKGSVSTLKDIVGRSESPEKDLVSPQESFVVDKGGMKVLPDVSGNKNIKGEIRKGAIQNESSLNKAINEAKTSEAQDAVQSATDEIVEDVDEKESNLKKTLDGDGKTPDEGGTRSTDEGYKPYAGDGSTIRDLAKDGDGEYDAYSMDDTAFENAKREYQIGLERERASAPSAAIELMGIEHYYPPQEDFIKSNFTGRYIGSRTLVSPTGALYAEGLVDARERAIEEKATAKAAAQDKYWELTDTAPQYDEKYKDIGMDLMEKYGDASGWDFNALSNSGSKLGRQFRRDMYDYKSRGKNLLEVSNLVNTMIAEEATDPEKYIPPEIKKVMMDVRSAELDFDAYMRGEGIGDKKMRGITNMLRSYESFPSHMNTQLDVMQKMGMDEDLIASGADFNDKDFAQNAQDAIDINKNNPHWLDYRTAMMKHYNVDRAEEIVRGIYAQNELWEGTGDKEKDKIIQASTRMFISHLPKQTSVTHKLADSKYLGMLQLAQRKYEFSKKSEWTERDFTNLYDDTNTAWEAPEFRADMKTQLAGVRPSNGTAADDKRYQRDFIAAQKSVMVKHKHNISDARGYTTSIIPTPGDMVATVPSRGNATKVWDDNGKPTTVGRRLTKLKNLNNPTEEDLQEIDDLVYIQGNQGKGMRYNPTTTEASDWIYLNSIGKAVPSSDPRAAGLLDNESLKISNLERSGGFRMPTNVTDKDGNMIYRESVVQLVEDVNLGNAHTRRGAAGSIKEREGLRTGKGTKAGEPAGGFSESSGSGG